MNDAMVKLYSAVQTRHVYCLQYHKTVITVTLSFKTSDVKYMDDSIYDHE